MTNDLLALSSDILRHVTGMAWKIAWALVLGFGVSAGVQAFVPARRVARHLGATGWKPLALATGFGAASSSCSYAAAAMSKTLFRKGAHPINATAFLIASTNLVVEIGLVIWLLLGWRFVVAEIAGGLLLIAVTAALLGWLAPASLFERAREHLERAATADGHDHRAGETLDWRRIPTLEGLEAAGRCFASDWRMVGKDVVLGILIAGTLAAAVPTPWWQTLFLAGHSGATAGFWVSVENAVVGPLIALLSFVCSVGNIPLAAVLWAGQASFGGVVAFIFADLVTIPMILVYRRYYGWTPALLYTAYLLVAIVLTALAVDWSFRWVGLAADPAVREGLSGRAYFAWDYTTVLNLIFLPLGIVLYLSGRRH